MPSFQERLLHGFQDKLLPWLQDGVAKIVLGQPPFQVPDGVQVTPRNAPVLKKSREGRSWMRTAHWPQEGLHTGRFPIIGCVLEGEADFVIGVTERMVEANRKRQAGRYLLALPERTFFVIPPGVPYSDGSRPH